LKKKGGIEMSDERFEKLLGVMLEVKDTVTLLANKIEKLELGQMEMNERLERIEDNIDLLAQKNWKNEKDIYRLKKLMSVE
jgi:hypothetical protein